MAASLIHGQPFDLLLQGSRIIDPQNGIDGLRDVAIAGTTLAAVAPSRAVKAGEPWTSTPS